MLSRVESGRKVGENSRDGRLMRDIDVISKGLYADKNPLRKSINASKSTRKPKLVDLNSKSKSGNEDKEKKSIWNWKPLKAFATDRNRKFNCCFSLQVHFIEGFLPSFNKLSVCVRWKRRDGELSTRPVKVFEGTAEFEQKLMHICTVYGRRSGPHHSAKYEAKHFLLYASVVGRPELDLGKHRVDLTRLLPLTLEELEEEKRSGNWTTSFKLTGEAKGAVLNVSFGYTVVGDNFLEQGHDHSASQSLSLKNSNPRHTKSILKCDQEDGTSTIHRTVSHPGTFHQYNDIAQPVDDIRDLHEVVSTSKSDLVNLSEVLSQEEAEDNLDSSVSYKQDVDVSAEQFLPTKPDSFVSGPSPKGVPTEYEDDEYTVTETGITLSADDKEQVEVTAADVSSIAVGVDCSLQEAYKDDNKCHLDNVEDEASETELLVHDYTIKEEDVCSKESVMKELEAALTSVSKLETEALDYPEDTETYLEVNNDVETNRMERSLSFDGVTDSLADQFLDMLGVEHSPSDLRLESEPESPRELLLREFEKDVLANGCKLFDFETNDDENETKCGFDASNSFDMGNAYDDFELQSFIQAAELEHQVEPQVERNKIRAKALEDLEMEVLMHEWGLNDDAFKCSPPKNPHNFGNPIDLPPEEPLELPPLSEGLGPILQTKDGGFLRSMNPSLFKNAKTGGNLIMQVSNPVVVPAEKGAGVMDILQQLASVGIEKLSMQANKLMPLEDITGKTVQQVAWDAAAALEGPERQNYMPSEPEPQHDISGGWLNQEQRSSAQTSKRISPQEAGNKSRSEYVSLEDLAPLAMDKIEALSIEGLRIQSGMSDEEAPSNISSQSIGEISALRGKGVNNSASLGMEGTAGLQLLDIKDSGEDMTGLMDLSLTLDEWLRLDSGDIGDEDEISERTSKILAAHHANSLDIIRGGSKGERRRGKGSGRKCGLLGNNFTVALMVQLRDPLRDYDQVGTPMLALIQVERVFVPPKPRIFRKVSELRNDDEEDEETAESVVKEEKTEEKALQEEAIPQFKITEVHVAGLKPETGKKSFWGANKQQQSGSRWLLANGMGKGNKHPLMKSKAVSSKSATPAASKPKANETLWSISSRAKAAGAKSKSKDLAVPKPHIRNPNIYFC